MGIIDGEGVILLDEGLKTLREKSGDQWRRCPRWPIGDPYFSIVKLWVLATA